MRRIVTSCLVLFLVALLVAPMFDAAAQNIQVSRIGRSLNSMTPPVKGAAAPAWNISTGLRAVGIQSRAYFKVDTTGSGATGTPTWTIVSKPGTSTATLDSTGTYINSIQPDVVGEYVVSATVGAKTDADTILASTYTGVGTDAQAGCFCHPTVAASIKTSWSNTAHAKIFKDGMTGYLETELGKGAYTTSCIKCHTTGWDPAANNNNFGYQVNQSGWDTTWYKGLQTYNGDYWITSGDTSKYMLLNASQMAQGTIGCESCHGPLADHKSTADPKKAGVSLSADVCNVCHDGARRHSLGTFFNLSKHALPPSEPGVTCQPCHTGSGFLYFLDHNKDTTGISATWNASTDGMTSITCQICHDPHSAANPFQLRTITLKGDSLRNGYILPANLRTGTGLLCANCHSSRYSVKKRVTSSAPYYGFVNRFGPHENPQADMFFGTNGYQYGDESFTGLTTHTGLEGGCATCHMQDRKNSLDGGGNMLPNHSFSMSDTTFAGNGYKPTDVCGSCHGEIEDFNDVKAFYDYDRNGSIEGVQTEVQGLLNALKAKLPIDTTTGEPTTSTKDSLKVKNHPEYVQGIWNYYFVKNDHSMGIHNTKYAVRLLYKSLGWTPLSVKAISGVATEFALSQNYPNPFNPTTNIRFSLPNEQHVKLQIFDITGALVKTLIDQAIRGGNMEVAWDGTNAAGTKVSSGMYLYRLQAGEFSTVKKMVLMK